MLNYSVQSPKTHAQNVREATMGQGRGMSQLLTKVMAKRRFLICMHTENAQSILKKVTLVLYITKNLVGV